MSANFTGCCGTRILASSIAFPTASEFSEKYYPFKQSILHGGLSLRNLPLPYEDLHGTYLDPSKPDATVSWRRGSTTNSVLNSSCHVKVTPPPGERISPPPSGTSFSKLRLRPLSFVSAVHAICPLPSLILIMMMPRRSQALLLTDLRDPLS